MYACCAHKSKQIRSFKSSIILNMHIYFSETKKHFFFLGGGGGEGSNKNHKICLNVAATSYAII